MLPARDVSRFESGAESLDAWLRRKARLNEAKGGARTYVVCDGDRVIGRRPGVAAVDARPQPGRGIVRISMAETTAIVVSIVGTGIGIIGVMGLMLRILTTNIGNRFDANAAQMRELKADLGTRIDDTNRRVESLAADLGTRIDDTNRRVESLTSELKADLGARIDDTNRRVESLATDLGARIDDTNRRIESLTSEMHQRFDRVHQELAENRERMARLEGSLDGFLAGRRDRDAA